jgi:hypothetical protein
VEFQPVLHGELGLAGQAKSGYLRVAEEADKDVDAAVSQAGYLVGEPVPASWPGHGVQAAGAAGLDREQVRPHRCLTFCGDRY